MEEIAAQNNKFDFHEHTYETYIKKPSTRPVAKCIHVFKVYRHLKL